MARILVVVGVLAATGAAGAAVFARGSPAAPKGPAVARPAPAAVPEAGPAALPEAASTVQRTFVSTAGSDANPCTAAQPCRSFTVAIANTTAGGEVVALDSGGYGPFTVNKAITIAGAPGAHVAISVFTGTGIYVNAGAADAVVLRNLYLTGLGGGIGIRFQGGGSLHVESVVAAGFTSYGLYADLNSARLIVRDSVFRRNGATGLVATGSLQVAIADSRADRNNWGFDLDFGARGSIVRSAASGNNGFGFIFERGAVFSVSDALADGSSNTGGAGVAVVNEGTQATLRGMTLTNNTTYGLVVDSNAVARIAGSTVIGNEAGLAQLAGTLETFGDNLVRGNFLNVYGTLTTVGKT